MSPLSVVSGHKNQKILQEAFRFAKINQAIEKLYTTDYPEFNEEFKQLTIQIKNDSDHLKLTLKSTNIQFLAWMQTQNLDQKLSNILTEFGILENNFTLKLIYKII